MKRNLSYIDRLMLQKGIEFFGEIPMSRISDEQIEEARVMAFNDLHDLTQRYGEQKKGTLAELFCNYIFENFI